MISAYLFINLEMEEDEIDTLGLVREIDEVKEAFSVYGTYDIIILIEAKTIRILRDIIFRSVHHIKHVQSTMTLLSLSAWEKTNKN